MDKVSPPEDFDRNDGIRALETELENLEQLEQSHDQQ